MIPFFLISNDKESVVRSIQNKAFFIFNTYAVRNHTEGSHIN